MQNMAVGSADWEDRRIAMELRTETQTAEEESDSDDKEPQPGPSQGYLFELTSYIKNVAEKKK